MNDKRLRQIGWVLTGLVALGLCLSGVMKVSRSAQVLEGFAKFGYPDSSIVPIGLTELVCALLFLVPRTSVLGAILVTGYLGGAVATHVRAAEPFVSPAILGVLAWAALFARDPRLRALLPLRSSDAPK